MIGVKIIIIASSSDGIIMALFSQKILVQSSLLDGIRSLQVPLLREEVEQLPVLKIVIFSGMKGRVTEGMLRLHNARRPRDSRRTTRDRRPLKQY